MTTRRPVLAIAVLLVAGGIAGWLAAGADRSAGPNAARLPPEVAGDDAPHRPLLATTPDVAPTSAREREADVTGRPTDVPRDGPGERAALSGRVVDAEGHPVPGALVFVQCSPADAPPAEREARSAGIVLGAGPVAPTGPDGAFRVTGLVAGTHQVGVRTHVTVDEGIAQSVVLAAGEHREGLELRLPPSPRLRGRVLDAEGRPAVDLELTLRRRPGPHDTVRPTGRTDADGNFDIRVPVEGDYEGWSGRVHLQGTAATDDPRSVLTFDPAFRPELVVRISGPDGTPVPRALCTVMSGATSANMSGTRQEARDGVARVPVASLAAHVEVHVEDPCDAQGAALPLVETVVRGVDPDAGEVHVRLAAAARIRGRVVDEEQRPVAGATVRAVAGTDDEPREGGDTSVSDADGRFDLVRVPPGPVRVRASHRRSGWLPTRPVLVEAPASDVTVRVQRGADLEVEVVGPDGEGVPDVRVHALARAPGAAQAWATTDENGRAVLEALMPGDPVEVRAFADGTSRPYASTGAALRATPPGRLRIVLDPGYEVSGVVVDASGAPMGLVPVVGRDAGQGGVVENTLSEPGTGAFVLRRMRAGRAEVWLGFGSGNRPPTAPVEVPAPSAGVRLVAPRSVEVRGRLLVPDPEAWRVSWALPVADAGATIDADGSFRIPHASGSRGSILARPLDPGDPRVALLEGVAPEAGPYVLVPLEGGTIVGRVEGVPALELSASRFHVVATRGHVRLQAVVGPSGAFRITGVPAGPWDLDLWTHRPLARVPSVLAGRDDVVLHYPAAGR